MPKIVERVDKRGARKKSNFSTTIPVNLMRIMKWKKGDELLISKLDDERLVMEKVDID